MSFQTRRSTRSALPSIMMSVPVEPAPSNLLPFDHEFEAILQAAATLVRMKDYATIEDTDTDSTDGESSFDAESSHSAPTVAISIKKGEGRKEHARNPLAAAANRSLVGKASITSALAAPVVARHLRDAVKLTVLPGYPVAHAPVAQAVDAPPAQNTRKRSASASAEHDMSAAAAEPSEIPVASPTKKRRTTVSTHSSSSASGETDGADGPQPKKALPFAIDEEAVREYSATTAEVGKRNAVTWTKNPPRRLHPTEPSYDLLTPAEVRTCEILCLSPTKYLDIKIVLLSARAAHGGGVFKKRDAQGWVRVDVNKLGKVYDWFVGLGWLVKPGK
ncbi:Transcriptional adapter ada2 [Irineochytrium annulatum]|nr:Transcriptional adapter ada2 [Irineochytrium annulatum]